MIHPRIHLFIATATTLVLGASRALTQIDLTPSIQDVFFGKGPTPNIFMGRYAQPGAFFFGTTTGETFNGAIGIRQGTLSLWASGWAVQFVDDVVSHRAVPSATIANGLLTLDNVSIVGETGGINVSAYQTLAGQSYQPGIYTLKTTVTALGLASATTIQNTGIGIGFLSGSSTTTPGTPIAPFPTRLLGPPRTVHLPSLKIADFGGPQQSLVGALSNSVYGTEADNSGAGATSTLNGTLLQLQPTQITFQLNNDDGHLTGPIGIELFDKAQAIGSGSLISGVQFRPVTLTLSLVVTSFRTDSGTWTGTSEWAPRGIPNGSQDQAELILPVSGTQSVDLLGATFTINQLNVTGSGAGAWNVSKGTLILDGFAPTFTNQSAAAGISARVEANLQLKADTAFDIVNLSGETDVSGTVSGTGKLVKTGGGTLKLTGLNTYSGGTNLVAGTLAVKSDANLGTGPLSFNGGTLQALAAGGGITSRKVITLNEAIRPGSINSSVSPSSPVAGNGTFFADAGTVSTLSGVISGPGSLTKDGPGSLTLTGENTFTGGAIIKSGTLTVKSPQALGLGDVVNRGILKADPQSINVKGDYTQEAGGTLQLEVSGTKPGQYETLNVSGNAVLGGTLELISPGFRPVAGEKLMLVTAGGEILDGFDHVVDSFATGPGSLTVELVEGHDFELLEFVKLASPGPSFIVTTDFSTFALTPNQLAAANLLEAVQLDSRATNFISFLHTEAFDDLPGDFEKISPEGLTAFYEISFSNANIQKLNLESRLDDLHHGSNGFSSNMKINGASVNFEDRADADGKSSKAVMEPILQPGPENRWGVWMTGFGDFVNVDADGNASGYNFTTGGVSLGLDYRITDHLAIGVMGEYSHTWTSLNPGGHIDVDSGRGGVYATWFSHGIFINGAIYGGYNNYDSGRAGLGGLATGSTEGSEWSTFIGGGYDFHIAQLTVGPIASLQYTDVGVDSFGEQGSLAPLDMHSGSAESLRSDVGFRAFYQWQIGKMVVEPSLKAAWEHEFKYSALPITAGFAGISGPSATFFGPSEGHDSAVVGAGISVQVTPAITTYVNYDGQLGRGNYDSNAVTGGVRISF